MKRQVDARRRGAKAIDGATDVKRVTICLTEEDHEKLGQLGGSPWVRRKIREERLPNVKSVKA